MFSFSTCWNSQRHTDGRAMLAEIRALGFEYAELGHGVRLSLMDGIVQAVQQHEIKISSLHNFCPLPVGLMGPAPDYYLPSTRKEREREQAVRHTLRTINCAASLGAHAVVLHLGLVPMRSYTMRLIELFDEGQTESRKFQRLRTKALLKREARRKRPLDQVFRTLDTVLPVAKSVGVKLGLETRMALHEIPNDDEVAEIMARFGTDVTGYWHDIGHAQMKENIGITTHEGSLERFRGKTLGMHLQDFAPPVFDHQPPGFGSFNFARLSPFVTDDMVLAWEIHPEWKAEQVTSGLKQAHDTLRKPVPV